jgi:hypothetical protein
MRKQFSIAVLCAALALPAAAQTITGTITGTVTDPSGAAVPNAKVTATNVGTSVTFSATTTTTGVYNLLFLPVASYTVAVEQSGFKKATLGPIKIEVNQTARLDVSLQVGQVTETVEVKDVAPILQTESTATGDTITSTKLTSIPLNGRNFASLTLLIPGAISTNPNAMNTVGRFQGSGSRPQVNGNREQTNNFMLDGVDVNDSIDNRIGYNPNVDALEEVKVLTGNAGGEFGNAGGGSVLMTLKSGTNQFHGNVFEFLRNDKFDANGFFANRANQARRPLRRNIFGGTLGGPIVRNKMFFFVDYEQTEQRASGPATASVAPAEWRTGDLSQFLRVNNQIIRDPLTGDTLASRAPFPNNQIPRARFNPVATALFGNQGLYPLPNNQGVGPLGVGSNYLSSSASSLSNKQGDAKWDYRLSDKDNVAVRYSRGFYESFGSRNPLPIQMTGGTTGPTQSVVANWTRTISTRMVNDARIAYSRIGIDDNVVDWSGQLGPDANSRFGISGGQPIAGLSSVTVGGGLTGIGSTGVISSTVDNKYQAQTNATYQTGKHLIKFGGQMIRFQQNRYYSGNNGALGVFRYNGAYSGVDIGDFMVNALNSKGRGAIVGKWGHRHWRNALFIQDDVKVTRNFTVNLGLRWEYVTPIYEVADRQVNINTFTGQLILPGQGEFGRALYKPYKKQFMPTIGLAYSLNSKLVVRAGYRFSNFLEGTGANLRLPLNPPFFVEADVTYDARTPGDIRTGFSDVISRGDLTGPRTGANPFFQARAWDLNLRPQFTNQYNLTVEYQLDSTTSLSAAFVGQKGTHLVVPHEANQPLPGTGPVNTWAPINDRRPLARALPNVGNIALTESSGTMTYNAFQLSGRRRMAGGVELMGHYTLSKTLTDNLGYYGCGGVAAEGAYWQNAYDRRGNFGPACFDARHNVALGGAWDLPVGKGKKFGNGMSRAADLIIGGWNVNYMMTTHTGFPVTIFAGAHQANTFQSVRGNVRANRYRNMPAPATRTVDRWFGDIPAGTNPFCASGVDNGTCAYGIPAIGQFGNSGVGTERAPGFFQLDMSIGKKFAVTERQYLEFRAEFFSLPNNVSWGAPGRDITSPAGFGTIGGQLNAARNIQFGLKYFF